MTKIEHIFGQDANQVIIKDSDTGIKNITFKYCDKEVTFHLDDNEIDEMCTFLNYAKNFINQTVQIR